MYSGAGERCFMNLKFQKFMESVKLSLPPLSLKFMKPNWEKSVYTIVQEILYAWLD